MGLKEGRRISEWNNRSVIKTVSADLVVGTWASLGALPYNKAMNEAVANEEFTSLCCIVPKCFET